MSRLNKIASTALLTTVLALATTLHSYAQSPSSSSSSLEECTHKLIEKQPGNSKIQLIRDIVREKYGEESKIVAVYVRDDLPIAVFKVEKPGSPAIAVKVQHFQGRDGKSAQSAHEFNVNRALWENDPDPGSKFANLHNVTSHSTSDGGTTTLIEMEYYPYGSLRKWMKESVFIPKNFEAYASLFKKIAQAVGGMHAHHFVHGDLKPGNIMVVPGPDGISVILIDFALTARLGEYPPWQRKSSGEPFRAGTEGYASYDQANDRPAQFKDDLHSLSIVFRMVLCGELIDQEHKMNLVKLASPYSLIRNYEGKTFMQKQTIKRIAHDDFYKVLSAIAWHRFESIDELLSALQTAEDAYKKEDPALFFRFFYNDIIKPMSAKKRNLEREREERGSSELREYGKGLIVGKH